MMSMVPEEASIISSNAAPDKPETGNQHPAAGAAGNARQSRAFETISQIRTVGSISASVDQLNLRNKSENNFTISTLPRMTNGSHNSRNGAIMERTLSNSESHLQHGRSNETGIFSRGNSFKTQTSQTLPRTATFNGSRLGHDSHEATVSGLQSGITQLHCYFQCGLFYEYSPEQELH